MKNKKFIDGFILRFSMVLMAIFVCGFAFISCEPGMEMMEDVTQPTTPTTPEPTTPTTPDPTTPTTPTEQGTEDLEIGGTEEEEDDGEEEEDDGEEEEDDGEEEEEEDDSFGADPNVDP